MFNWILLKTKASQVYTHFDHHYYNSYQYYLLIFAALSRDRSVCAGGQGSLLWYKLSSYTAKDFSKVSKVVTVTTSIFPSLQLSLETEVCAEVDKGHFSGTNWTHIQLKTLVKCQKFVTVASSIFRSSQFKTEWCAQVGKGHFGGMNCPSNAALDFRKVSKIWNSCVFYLLIFTALSRDISVCAGGQGSLWW